MFIIVLSLLTSLAFGAEKKVADFSGKVAGKKLEITYIKYKTIQIAAGKIKKCDLKKWYWQPDFSMTSALVDGAWVRDGVLKNQVVCKDRVLAGMIKYEAINFREEVQYKPQLEMIQLAVNDVIPRDQARKLEQQIELAKKNIPLPRGTSKVELVFVDISEVPLVLLVPELGKAKSGVHRIVFRFDKEMLAQENDQVVCH